MKLPVIKAENCTTGWIISILLGLACLSWRLFLLPGWEYSTAVFLLALTAILSLFSGETSRNTTQIIIMIFVVGTGILLVGSRFDIVMNGMSFGPSLIPVNGQLGILGGLLWLIPMVTSLRLANRFSTNIYVRSLFGAVLVLAPTLFMLLSSETQMLFFWRESTVTIKAILIWFFGGFFFHFAANQMGAQRENPIATRIYFVYLGFFAVAWILNLLVYRIEVGTPL